MARQVTARSTIKNDPFASVIPTYEENAEDLPVQDEPVARPAKAPPFRRSKITVHLREDLIERVKNAAYWNPRLTIASIAEMGIYQAIEAVEKENGGPYPRRQEELRGGRPMK